jgi:hypothetical protein
MSLQRWLAVCALLAICGFKAHAQDGPDQSYTPPRLSYLEGEASFWRPGAEDWVSARLNTPLAAGDGLYAGRSAIAELQLGSRAFVRAAENTQLTLIDQTHGFLQFKLTGGRVSFDLRYLPADYILEIDTPDALFTIQNPGYYRLDVGGETHFVTRLGGLATVVPAGGAPKSILPSEDVVVQAGPQARVTTYIAPEPDQWDRWNFARTEDLIDSLSARYLSPGIAGVDDLDHHGTWRVVPDYGPVWVPYSTSPGWVPYSTGSWVWDPNYEWTWVDDAPWGWAPYHYGRWVNVAGVWAWAPGPVIAHRPPYAPALVAFFGSGHGVTVGLQVGAPGMGWVALSWGEPLLPWWGKPEFRGRPTWRGWGGPREGDKFAFVPGRPGDVSHFHYRNATVPHTIVFDPDGRFGRNDGHVAYRRLDRPDGLAPVHGELPVKPNAQSLFGGAPKGIRPPPGLMNRPVVSAHPPPEVRRPWHREAAGEGKAATPQTRYVSPPARPWTELPRPEFGVQGGSERERPSIQRRFGEMRPPSGPPPAPSETTKRQIPTGKSEQPRPVIPEVRVPGVHPVREAAPRMHQETPAQPERPEAKTRGEARGGMISPPPGLRPPPRTEGQTEARPRLPGRPANQTYRQPGQGRGDKGP